MIINSYIGGAPTPPSIYDDALGTFSFLKRFNWTHSVGRIQRDSDDAIKHVFFDGDGITLNSFVGDNSSTPSATTLGTWIGSDNGFLDRWYFQKPSDVADTYLEQTTRSLQFQIIVAGVLNTDGGNAAADTLSGLTKMVINSGSFSELDDDQNWTLLTVSNDSSAVLGVIASTSSTAGSGYMYQVFDRRSVKRHTRVYDGSSVLDVDLSAQVSSTATRLQTSIRNATNFKSYLGNVLQNTVAHSNKNYVNDTFIVGTSAGDTLSLEGDICEIMIFASDKSTDNLTTIQNQLITDWGV